MDEIRFNQPPKEEIKKEEKSKRSLNFNFKKLLKWFGIAVILILVVAFVFLGKDFLGGLIDNNSSNKNGTEIKGGDYSAVFLSNGQVYFGKLISKNNSEFVLTDVYYLQLSGNETLSSETKLNETTFSLIKLGNELHGPMDELFIITSQVLFYENLRDDSRVVQAIKNYSDK